MQKDWGIEAGISLEEVLLRIDLRDRDDVQRLITEAMASKTPYRAEYRVLRPDGVTVWIEARGKVTYDVNSNAIRFFGTSLNITDRKNSESQLAFERHKLKTVIANSSASIAILRSENFTYELTNRSYEELFSNRELIGKPLLEALPELADQEFPRHAKSVFETGTPYVEREARALLKRTEGGPLEERYFDQTYSRITDEKNEPYGIFMHAQEVTDRVVTRRELELAKASAEHANQTKSSFLANMSHEIRTPLGAILGFSDLLKDPTIRSEERAQFLDTISRNGKALTKIIDDILDLAKVESGKLEIERTEFSFFDLIDDVMDLFRERTRAKGIYLRANLGKDAPSRIVSDPTRLRQILINVVGNAVKFTNNGGVTIDVIATKDELQNINFQVFVKDTGLGISAEQRTRIFQPFMQADNTTTRKFGGTGLGLTLSKRLANALSGDVSIEDCNLGEGSTFLISFQARQANAVRAETNKEQPKVAGNKLLENLKVLIADDSKDNLFLVSRILTAQGAEVETANNGLEAFRMGMSGKYDALLMDIQMPEMDGYEATRALREAGFKKPIIALTAHAMAEERARSLAAGCDGHLTKPLSQKELIETLSKYMPKVGPDRV